ncbi:hypothetical protein Pcinc_013818 [Petrolisthes cinctipes]|uniref:Uncharacterized protein n=1 Tax=Petrolisthes cinctipes TaxID=88211 RepID=A0AAE1FW64_PETCI|nr:hypothetical protein Pcinc_013818 [Petrolisthes cinctipes]
MRLLLPLLTPPPSFLVQLAPSDSSTVFLPLFIHTFTRLPQVRQNYIKRRLVTTYKALQRFSQSEVDLETGVGTAGGSTAASGSAAGVKIDGGGVTLVVPTRHPAAQDVFKIIKKEVELPVATPPSSQAKDKNLSLTARDVERDRGRPLTKYERNMMIFNWLQTLEDTAYDIMS